MLVMRPSLVGSPSRPSGQAVAELRVCVSAQALKRELLVSTQTLLPDMMCKKSQIKSKKERRRGAGKVGGPFGWNRQLQWGRGELGGGGIELPFSSAGRLVAAGS